MLYAYAINSFARWKGEWDTNYCSDVHFTGKLYIRGNKRVPDEAMNQSCETILHISTVFTLFQVSKCQESCRSVFFSPEQKWSIESHSVAEIW